MKSGRGRKSRIPATYAVDLAKAELLRLYLADEEFSEEFESVRQRHETTLCQLLRDTSDSGTTENHTPDDSETEIMKLLEKTGPGISRAMEIGAKAISLEKATTDYRLEGLVRSRFSGGHVEELVELAKDLRRLAIRFGFDYSWAVPYLLSHAITEMVPEVIAISDRDKCRELIELLCSEDIAKSLKWPPLVITIPAAFVLWLSEGRILEGVRKRLRAYKVELAESGVSLDTQDALHRQIRWLFAHKRHRLSAKETMDTDYLGNTIVGYSHIADTIRNWDKRLTGQCSRVPLG
jgi:hypothetical protein